MDNAAAVPVAGEEVDVTGDVALHLPMFDHFDTYIAMVDAGVDAGGGAGGDGGE